MHIYKLDENGELKPVEVTKISIVEESAKYYHVVSTEFYNIFANDVLTTDDEVILSNLYGFDDQVMLALFSYAYENRALHRNYIQTVAERLE